MIACQLLLPNYLFISLSFFWSVVDAAVFGPKCFSEGVQILGVRVPLESELFRRGVSAQGLPCQWLTSWGEFGVGLDKTLNISFFCSNHIIRRLNCSYFHYQITYRVLRLLSVLCYYKCYLGNSLYTTARPLK